MEEHKMGTMPVNKLLLTMAAPMILSMLIGALYNIVDSIFVSNYSENALTAVSLAFPVQNIIVSMGTGLGVGANAMLSRFLGEKKQDDVNKTALNGILLGIITYVFILAFGLFGARWFYSIQTNNAEISQMGISYLSIVCIFSLGQILDMIFEKLLQSTGRTAYSMWTQISGAVLNIILDPILIFGYFGLPAMGATGAAIATVIGQFCSMFVGFLFNLKKNKEIQFSVHHFHPEGYYLKYICAVGIPAAITMFLSSIMSFGINKILLGYSTTAIAVFGAYFKLQTFVAMATFGLNSALLSIVAFNLGTRKHDRIRKAIKLSAIYSILIGAFGMLILQVFPAQIMSAFNASETMSAMGVTALRIASLSFMFACASVMICYTLQGLGKGISSMFISMARQVICLLPLAYILGNMFGIKGIWISFPIAEVIVMIVGFLYLNSLLRKMLK